MSQILSQIPHHLLLQQQRLTPQLIQAMDILQLNTLALESRITQELDGNPALELLPDDDEVLPTVDTEPTAPEQTEGERALVVEDGGTASAFERLDNLVSEYDWIEDDGEYRGRVSRARSMEVADNKLDAMANSIARPPSLQEFLLQQWHMVEVDERTRAIGNRIIERIEDNGRLTTPLIEIAGDLQPVPSPEELNAVLAAVQMLDPPGIAARSLQECLLLQLEALPGENTLEKRIVREHFENLLKNRLPTIAKALGIDVEEVKAVTRVIGSLALHPGTEVFAESPPVIVPDVLVEYLEREDCYDSRLTRGNTRELRISPEFRELLEQSRGDKQSREFIKQKIEAASAIIDAVRYRRERLLEVAKAVVEAQRAFLDHGEQHLKVLRMSELAERFHCDPSTISRTVDEKYVQTPRGVYPLRMFFTGGAETDNGEELGWASIRAKVQQIISEENKSNPLSDDEIVDQLKAAGIEIKRRTVAKYRGQLAIPPSRQRKQF